MAIIAICTHCSGELVLTDPADGDGSWAGQQPMPEQRIVCPLCGAQFSVEQTTLRSLPETPLLADLSVQQIPSMQNLQVTLEPQQNGRPQHHGRQAPRSSRTVATVMGVGIVLMGGLLGQYILLWLRGSEADFIHMAPYLPVAILPPSMHALSANLPSSSPLESASLAAHDQDLKAPKDQATGQNARAVVHTAPAKTSREPSTGRKAATDFASHPLKVDHQIQPASAQLAPTPTPQRTEAQLRGAAHVDARQLAAALKAADQAQADLLSGELSSREAVIRKGRSFITLCNLAEKLTFVDRGKPQTLTQQLLAKELFRDTMRQPKTRIELARIAARWLDHPQRTTPGLFCTGRIVDLKSSGPWTEYTLALGSPETFAAPVGSATQQATAKAAERLPETARKVVVVTSKRRYGIGKQIGLVGVIVDPRQLDHYLADRSPAAPPAVVYSRFLYDLDQARKKTGRPTGQALKSVFSNLDLQ